MRRTSQGGSKATTRGRSTRSGFNKTSKTEGIRPTADRASPDWWEEDEHGDCDDGDKKKQTNKNNNKPRGIFTQSWAERYNMDNLVNLKGFSRVELLG